MASVEIMLRFKDKDRGKKNKKRGFHCGIYKVSAELSSTEDNQRENNCRRFSSSSPSTTTFTPETVHAVISVIHEKVYDIIQTEVSRKKLKSSTSVASSSSKTEIQRRKRQGIL